MHCVRGPGWVEMERCRPSVGPGEAEAMGFNYLLWTSHVDLDPDLEETSPFKFAITIRTAYVIGNWTVGRRSVARRDSRVARM